MSRHISARQLTVLYTKKRVAKMTDKVPKRIIIVPSFVPLGFDGLGKECDYTSVKDECSVYCYLNQARVLSFTMGIARRNRVNVWVHCREFYFPGSLKFFSTKSLTTFKFVGEGWNLYFFWRSFKLPLA